MEQQKVQSKASFKRKLPDVEKTREMIQYLKAKEEKGEQVTTSFSLAPQLHAEAELEQTGGVAVWLGANVALEYSYDDALVLLDEREKRLLDSLSQIDEDLAWLKDQITTMEVSMARVYNHEVQMKRKSGSSSSAK